ncbi:MAG: 50S ribosomal protein L22 [Patescibacteria group bacterium]
MDVQATHKFLRMLPRKVRLVAASVKGLSARHAGEQLAHSQKAAGEPLLRVLKSAIANAKQNHQIEEEALTVKNFLITAGPVLKRFQPRAYGRASAIHKRTSHVTVILNAPEKPKIATKSEKPAKEAKKETAKENKKLEATKK